jgi:sugar phosphate isomerase/epimerase
MTDTTATVGPPQIALCWGTLIGVPLPALIDAAGAARLPAITVTARMYQQSRAAGCSDADLRAQLAACGVRVHGIDPLIGVLPGTPRPADVPEANRGYFEISEDDCYRAAEALGAQTINLAHFGGTAVPEQSFVDCLGPLAERARRHGLGLTLEFLPESAIPDLAAARRIVTAVAAANLGIMFDTWHFARTGGTLDQLSHLPAGLIGGVQISDRVPPAPGTVYAPMSGRLLPGEGELPLAETVRLLLKCDPGQVIAVEVFSEELQRLPPRQAAARVAVTAGDVLRRAQGA